MKNQNNPKPFPPRRGDLPRLELKAIALEMRRAPRDTLGMLPTALEPPARSRFPRYV